MSLLYPGIDDEDAMRWYENIHSMPQSTQTPPTTDTTTDWPLDTDWQNSHFNGGESMWMDSILDPDYRIEYDSGNMRLHGNMDGTNSLQPNQQDSYMLMPDYGSAPPFNGYSDISDLDKNDNPLDRRYSKEGFDMQTAEGYEAYLNSL
jgi:hypothetical protein